MRKGRGFVPVGEILAGKVGMLFCGHIQPPLCQCPRLAQLLLFKQFIAEMKSPHP
jgi:hypothetical protein